VLYFKIEFNFILIKKKKLVALISQIYFWNKTLHISDISSVHHQEFFHCTHSNGVCHTAYEQDQDGTVAVCTVKKLLMMDRGNVLNMKSFIPKINLRI